MVAVPLRGRRWAARRWRARGQGQQGFAYIGLMFAVAILGITLATLGVVWSTQIRREREAELLYTGEQFRAAIGRYVANGGQFPMALEDLVADSRTPVVRRYLRRIYVDPMTGNADWQLIVAPGGGIWGVASRSQDKPIKVAGFEGANTPFDKAECYCDWKFLYVARYQRYRRAIRPAGTP